MFDFIKKLVFTKREAEQGVTNSNAITLEVINSLRDGIALKDNRDYERALHKFDIAVDSGIHKTAYRERGYCLQILGFHPDAIVDFTKAIEIFPSNANNFYGRSLSKGSLGDYNAALLDIKEAIRLSEVESIENNETNKVAKKIGWGSATRLYESYLNEILQDMNEQDENIRNINIKPAVRRPK